MRTIATRHPQLRGAVHELSADARFAGASSQDGRIQIHSRSLDAEGVVVSLVSAAALRTLSQSGRVTSCGLMEALERQVADAALLLCGDQVDGVLLVGLNGLRLGPDAESIDTPWGLIRPAGMRFSLVTRDYWIDSGASALMEMPWIVGAEQPSGAAVGEAVDAAVRSLGLATLLAETYGQRPVALATWYTILGPLSDGTSSVFTAHLRFPQPHARPLDAARATTLTEWCQRLADLPPAMRRNIDIAERRIIEAAAEHADPGDALVDAVMAWENLFGSTPETAFKVTSALALLIEPTPANRSGLVRKLKKAYTRRSKYVHGQAVKQNELIAARDVAIDAGVKALRVLIAERADLLRVPGSERRAETLLLGALGPDA